MRSPNCGEADSNTLYSVNHVLKAEIKSFRGLTRPLYNSPKVDAGHQTNENLKLKTLARSIYKNENINYDT